LIGSLFDFDAIFGICSKIQLGSFPSLTRRACPDLWGGTPRTGWSICLRRETLRLSRHGDLTRLEMINHYPPQAEKLHIIHY